MAQKNNEISLENMLWEKYKGEVCYFPFFGADDRT